MSLPGYFYTLNHPMRWVDPYINADGSDRQVLTPRELRDRADRNEAYSCWLGKFRFKGAPLRGKRMIWQAVQVISTQHAERDPRDWWGDYRDSLFRVFTQPETRKCSVTGDWVQWYVLCPEDSEMVMRYQAKEKGIHPAPRRAMQGERWVSKDKRVNKCLLIPTECARHWRHETTAGKLDPLL